MPSLSTGWALPLAVLTIANVAGTWFKLISGEVPDPYLDEVFHVPQAQRYCRNDWSWDPKITTPPGLQPVIGCDTDVLRLLNVAAICALCIVAYDVLRTLGAPRLTLNARNSSPQKQVDRQFETDVKYDCSHTALNICLFPPLFFFSGLYYTDVISTLLVLINYRVFLAGGAGNFTALKSVSTILMGIFALFFRQTNIFWVGVFPAGLAVVESLKRQDAPAPATDRTFAEIIGDSWSRGTVYDVPVHDADLQDYAIVIASVALVALRSPIIVIKSVMTYVVLLFLFGGFVAWNGGVVLGDKSNHVATIHLPQMLYLWPYIGFFSLPLLVAPLLAPIVRRLPGGLLKTFPLDSLIGPTRISLPGIAGVVLFSIFGLLAVHYNTIVHPFTLADNRHYVFYVFRILRRHPTIKYLAVPVYYTGGYLVISVLGARSSKQSSRRAEKGHQPTSARSIRKPCQASFVIVWLATTALSVVSAPLVEPRYFIIPWMMWRLHVPAKLASLSDADARSKQRASSASLDLRLTLETSWHLAINTAVGYLFLYRGFSWDNEPGRIQRFLF
ncbi:glycosyltransferase family 59 protein [Aaosphaeria arxii CBS 175.79]|uniref:Dol-P-Glc:Glc(2)Man(9)GlcNAc(2)-PP-Dol alpha-1,2-glucosyltransferase n=1 Tax=Aaosphaeria arxii CBS 175.79 TaxID=1450172 RepID=A0A6A5XKM7_9PLEO|nr:glycosyltransferase family 59 protein [Aaosphaeria arxii CBS 175.79]KAF2013815.1 glycosyltransferase family 59 protein [Aaosphaeria arxii CBS 175.79]